MKKSYYQKGTRNRTCDECGVTFKESELLKRWDGAVVCKSDYDPTPYDIKRGNYRIKEEKYDGYIK